MKQLTLLVDQDGVKTRAIIQFARSKAVSFDYCEKFVRTNFGENAKICDPDKLRKRLERVKGGNQ